jgi:hypothetical protein
MNTVELIHGCYQVGCHLAFVYKGEVLEGTVRVSVVSDSDVLLTVETEHTLYELCIRDGQAVIVGPLYQEAA